MRDLAFLLAFLGTVPAAWGRVYVCVLLWAWISLIAPNVFLYSFASAIPYNKVVAALTALALLVSREEKKVRCDRTSLLVLVFFGIAALSHMTALADTTVGAEIFDKLWKIVLLNLLIVSFMRTRLRIHAMVMAVCLGIGFEATASGLKFLVSAGHFRLDDGLPSWGDNNHVALIVLMSVPLLGYIRETSEAAVMRLAALGGILLSVCCVLATNSRGGFIGLVVLTLAGMAGSRHRIRYLLGILLVGAMLSQVLSQHWVDRMNTIQAANDDNSFMGRVKAWKMSTLIALDHPLLGGGLHAVQTPSVWAAYRPAFDTLSFIPTDPPDPHGAHAAHSIYFELLGDTGFLGLAVYLAIMASSFRAGSRVKRLARDRPDLQWAASLAGKLQLCLIVFAVCGAALSAAYHDLNFIVFGLLSALHGTVVASLGAGQSRAGGATAPTVARLRLALHQDAALDPASREARTDPVSREARTDPVSREARTDPASCEARIRATARGPCTRGIA